MCCQTSFPALSHRKFQNFNERKHIKNVSKLLRFGSSPVPTGSVRFLFLLAFSVPTNAFRFYFYVLCFFYFSFVTRPEFALEL